MSLTAVDRWGPPYVHAESEGVSRFSHQLLDARLTAMVVRLPFGKDIMHRTHAEVWNLERQDTTLDCILFFLDEASGFFLRFLLLFGTERSRSVPSSVWVPVVRVYIYIYILGMNRSNSAWVADEVLRSGIPSKYFWTWTCTFTLAKVLIVWHVIEALVDIIRSGWQSWYRIGSRWICSLFGRCFSVLTLVSLWDLNVMHVLEDL